MRLPNDTLVAVADGEKLHLFRTAGNEDRPKLKSAGQPHVEGSDHSAGSRHKSSASNPDEGQDAQDMHAAAVAEFLNKAAQRNEFEHAVVIAPAKMLGELRKHYHKAFEGKLLKELHKDLTGQGSDVIADALEAA